jgi:hypothetical protein
MMYHKVESLVVYVKGRLDNRLMKIFEEVAINSKLAFMTKVQVFIINRVELKYEQLQTCDLLKLK